MTKELDNLEGGHQFSSAFLTETNQVPNFNEADSVPDFSDADKYIFKDESEYHSKGYVLEHTHIPDDPDDCPYLIVCASAGRSGSTALLALMASNPAVGIGFYQPWKTLVRHGDEYGDYVIPGVSEGVTTAVAKETSGPFNNAHEQFDPVKLMLEKGYPKEKIGLIALMKDPITVYGSNMKFEGGIKPDVLVENIHYTQQLYERYNGELGVVVPLAYELMASETTVANVFGSFGLPFHGTHFIGEDELYGKLVLGEASIKEEFDEIVVSSVSHGGFKVQDNGLVTPDQVVKYDGRPGTRNFRPGQLEANAQFIYDQTHEVYQSFRSVSAQALGQNYG